MHLTETCQPDTLNLITNVVTTPATTADVEVTPTVHQDLTEKDLLPAEHFVDTAYVSVDNLLQAQQTHHLDLVGPVAGGASWQAKAGQGFDVSCFAVDWDRQQVTCPQGKLSQSWQLRHEKYGHAYFEIRFSPKDCQPCSHRSDCTKSKRGRRVVSLRPQAEYEMLEAARARQETAEFKTKYKKRAGIEGTISQGTRSFELRRSRYLGLAKTHLQHLAIGAVINLTRVVTWWLEGEAKSTLYRSPFATLAGVT